MSLKRQAISGAAWSAADTLGRQAVSLGVFVVLARLLMPDDLGLFALVVVFYSFMQTLVDDGIGETLVQRATLQADHLSTAFWTNLAVAIGVAVVGTGLAGLGAEMAGRPQLAPLVGAQGLVLVVSALGGIHQAMLRRRLQFRALAVRTWISILLAGIVGIAMALSGCGIWSLFGQQLTERTISTAMLWRSGNWHPRASWSRRHAADLFGYTLRTVATRITILAHNQIDRVMIASLLGIVLLGHYVLATRITDTLITALIISMTTAAFSAFARMQDSRQRLREAFHGTLRAMMLVVAPAFFGVAVVAPTLVEALFGPRWEGAAPVVMLLALNGVPVLLMSMLGVVLRATGQPGRFLLVVAAGAVGNLAAAAIGARWGLSGVATALVIRHYVFLPALLWLARREIGASPMRALRDTLPAIAGVAAMLVTVLWVRNLLGGIASPPEAAVRLIVEILAGGTAYLAALLATGWRQLATMLRMARPHLPQPDPEGAA